MYDTTDPVWIPIARGDNWGSWMELHYQKGEDYAYMFHYNYPDRLATTILTGESCAVILHARTCTGGAVVIRKLIDQPMAGEGTDPECLPDTTAFISL